MDGERPATPAWRRILGKRRTRPISDAQAAWIIIGFATLTSFLFAVAFGGFRPGNFHRGLVGTFAPGVLAAAWLYASRPLESLRARGYESIDGEQASALIRWFGRDALRRLPPFEDTLVLPGRGDLSDFLWARALLTMAVWDRDPRHFPIMERGYRDITRAQADAILDTYGEWWAEGLPRADTWSRSMLEKWGGHLGVALLHLERASGKTVFRRADLLRRAGLIRGSGDGAPSNQQWLDRLLASGEIAVGD